MKDTKNLDNYSEQDDRLHNYLVNSVVNHIKNKLGHPATAEVVNHHIAQIHAAASVLNKQSHANSFIGGADRVGEINRTYPLETNLVQKYQTLAKYPGNNKEINEILDLQEGKYKPGMSIKNAMQQTRERLAAGSRSGSF